MPSDDKSAQPASCPDGAQEERPKAYTRAPRPVTGDELCEVLNRPDLAQLLGTPGETATTVSGTSNTAPLTDGRVPQPEAEVAFDTYTVNVSVTYNKLSIDEYVKLMKYGSERDIRTVGARFRTAPTCPVPPGITIFTGYPSFVRVSLDQRIEHVQNRVVDGPHVCLRRTASLPGGHVYAGGMTLVWAGRPRTRPTSSISSTSSRAW
ncbi:DUF6215 domain-containing protein [Streptomyces sp. NPDC088254]|uniref:DUF6215 domain-containing protein n=1 Tax=Streptomyces sp. NPDC088254 TaxID=3365847 RepID=UPI00381FBA25